MFKMIFFALVLIGIIIGSAYALITIAAETKQKPVVPPGQSVDDIIKELEYNIRITEEYSAAGLKQAEADLIRLKTELEKALILKEKLKK